MQELLLSLLSEVIEFLVEYQYLAMFGILLMCGLGLPLPEEVTLVGSGLLVGWDKADFLYSCIACILGILAGDSIIFGFGYAYGKAFLRSRPMRLLLTPRRQRKVARFFRKHGNKAVFFARFFAGVRIGVYAYAGSQRMSWFRFLFLDFLGALISGTLSIWVGEWAAHKFADNAEEAKRKALEIAQETGHWILAGIVAAIVLYVILMIVLRKRRARLATQNTLLSLPALEPGVVALHDAPDNPAPPDDSPASPQSSSPTSEEDEKTPIQE